MSWADENCSAHTVYWQKAEPLISSRNGDRRIFKFSELIVIWVTSRSLITWNEI